MNTISDTAGTALSTESTIKTEPSTLGQNEFMKLMLTQMQHQDPFKPTGNTEFIAQMAQFSSVTGIDAMRASLDRFIDDQTTTRMLNAASLVGRTAMISGNTVQLRSDSPVAVEYILPDASQSTTATITDQAGELVHRIALGARDRGAHVLEWDGTTTAKGKAPPGLYNLNVEYASSDGGSVGASVSVATTVKSVNLGATGSGLTLSTSDGREVGISDVRKFL